MSPLFVLQVDRLMELHFKYLEAVQLADKRIEGEKHVRDLAFIHTDPNRARIVYE